MPTPVETITPIRTAVAICLMIPFAVYTFEDVRTSLAFFSGHSICFLVLYTTLYFLSVMFGDMSIMIDASRMQHREEQRV